MATHRSAAVAARQRVNDHLQAQIDRLTSAVEDGIKAVENLEKVQRERDELLTTLDAQQRAAESGLSAAVDDLRSLGKSKKEIAQLLDIDPRLIRSRRPSSSPQTRAAAMPEQAPSST
ncbi:hypothetical protein [Cumulibacter manganitolerans]|uniref:hypothetical protein n=1 Tax=Cumulibacter manganitolerans TaxID=1884992 RepID=UPI001297EED5|nr:hypothetical protein [Cumulibacter manganitolerans]